MDKLKGISKGGWHPSGDPKISRDTWKADLKGMATGKKNDPNEAARNHQSAPLSTLKDPDSFGAPPKHTGSFGSTPATPTSPSTTTPTTRPNPVPKPQPAGGWGSVVPSSSAKKQEQEPEEEKPKEPYRRDTTGLRTDHLPPPPTRRDGANASSPAPPPRQTTAPAPAPPPRQSTAPVPAPPPRHIATASPPAPPRQAQSRGHQAPVPALPPRMNEHPDEYTPPPPPSYNEATQPVQHQDPAALNAGAMNRLGQAGVSVPGFGIGEQTAQQQSAPQGHGGQLSELQQRFARMNHGESAQSPSSPTSAAAAAAAHKKAPPPPPPPKRAGIAAAMSEADTGKEVNAPPPLPMASKPRPG